MLGLTVGGVDKPEFDLIYFILSLYRGTTWVPSTDLPVTGACLLVAVRAGGFPFPVSIQGSYAQSNNV